MSYTDKVATFLDSLDTFCDNVPPEDLELLLGPVLERMRSQPDLPLSGSPLGKYTNRYILSKTILYIRCSVIQHQGKHHRIDLAICLGILLVV